MPAISFEIARKRKALKEILNRDVTRLTDEEVLSCSEELIYDCDTVESAAAFDCVVSGNMEYLKGFIDGGLPVNTKNTNGATLLMYACYCNNIDIVKYLIERGADINAVTINGGTALFFAVATGNTSLVEYLSDNGVDINYAHKRRHVNAAHYAINKDFTTSNRLEMLSTLIKLGINLQATPKIKISAIDYARKVGEPGIVEYLETVSHTTKH